MLRTGWEHHGLLREMEQSSIADLLRLYKREKAKYHKLCVEYVNCAGELPADKKRSYELKCDIQKEAIELVARHIAEYLATHQ